MVIFRCPRQSQPPIHFSTVKQRLFVELKAENLHIWMSSSSESVSISQIRSDKQRLKNLVLNLTISNPDLKAGSSNASPGWTAVTYTIKASNFGPHRNFGPSFKRDCHHQNESYTRVNGIKVVEKTLIRKLCFAHVLHRIHPNKLRILQEYVQSFNEVQI